MTTQRPQKKKKLRNLEYYGLQDVFDRLYADSPQGKIFQNLMEIIMLEENIRLAYRNIKTNSGSKTPGTDGKTIQHLAKWNDKSLIRHVQKKFSWYMPQAVRRVEILKAGNPAKVRPLGIPTIMDRLV